MAIYKPLKNIIIPVIALVIGISISVWVLPSKMDHNWNQLQSDTLNWEEKAYQIKSSYILDEVEATTEEGEWSTNHSRYNVTAVVSDDTTFQFDVYFQEERIFVQSGDQWFQNQLNSRFVEELRPLNQPFEWIRQIINEADKLKRIKNGDQTIYKATFDTFNDFDFRGTLLHNQQLTTLLIKEKNHVIESVRFNVQPIRPDSIGLLNRYPERIEYTMDFAEIESAHFVLPEEAYESEKID